ncbi:Rsd/AlgQ family anti-sigma factor [Candidatus Pantoea carbekii]|uniref:Uncharacterized protein n=1 Tax=Candidatus Pantoea carbekii TaxID=1235990 RepID=U3U5C0_9GAMM|nr:Rsd/AlgQ family anti-sigma factor [Candidatus Pantoea carbekii]AKC32320.1 regulator of sigma D Rsd [Candidatus Pantoea carbekii]BAO00035.1 hypothetical protein HHS_00650 [Candidatus Pantoea carbekii]
MFTQLINLIEYVGNNNQLVRSWLYIRQKLLKTYYNVIGIKTKKTIFSVLNEKALDTFCYLLLDYLSIGHFSIYERIIKNYQLHSVTQMYNFLQKNTACLMQLYDKFLHQPIDYKSYMTFNHALSKVGEILESRFVIEDLLIQFFWNKKSKQTVIINKSKIAHLA